MQIQWNFTERKKSIKVSISIDGILKYVCVFYSLYISSQYIWDKFMDIYSVKEIFEFEFYLFELEFSWMLFIFVDLSDLKNKKVICTFRDTKESVLFLLKNFSY